jgi:hypothetical protein
MKFNRYQPFVRFLVSGCVVSAALSFSSVGRGQETVTNGGGGPGATPPPDPYADNAAGLPKRPVDTQGTGPEPDGPRTVYTKSGTEESSSANPYGAGHSRGRFTYGKKTETMIVTETSSGGMRKSKDGSPDVSEGTGVFKGSLLDVDLAPLPAPPPRATQEKAEKKTEKKSEDSTKPKAKPKAVEHASTTAPVESNEPIHAEMSLDATAPADNPMLRPDSSPAPSPSDKEKSPDR